MPDPDGNPSFPPSVDETAETGTQTLSANAIPPGTLDPEGLIGTPSLLSETIEQEFEDQLLASSEQERSGSLHPITGELLTDAEIARAVVNARVRADDALYETPETDRDEAINPATGEVYTEEEIELSIGRAETRIVDQFEAELLDSDAPYDGEVTHPLTEQTLTDAEIEESIERAEVRQREADESLRTSGPVGRAVQIDPATGQPYTEAGTALALERADRELDFQQIDATIDELLSSDRAPSPEQIADLNQQIEDYIGVDGGLVDDEGLATLTDERLQEQGLDGVLNPLDEEQTEALLSLGERIGQEELVELTGRANIALRAEPGPDGDGLPYREYLGELLPLATVSGAALNTEVVDPQASLDGGELAGLSGDVVGLVPHLAATGIGAVALTHSGYSIVREAAEGEFSFGSAQDVTELAAFVTGGAAVAFATTPAGPVLGVAAVGLSLISKGLTDDRESVEGTVNQFETLREEDLRKIDDRNDTSDRLDNQLRRAQFELIEAQIDYESLQQTEDRLRAGDGETNTETLVNDPDEQYGVTPGTQQRTTISTTDVRSGIEYERVIERTRSPGAVPYTDSLDTSYDPLVLAQQEAQAEVDRYQAEIERLRTETEARLEAIDTQLANIAANHEDGSEPNAFVQFTLQNLHEERDALEAALATTMAP